MIRLVEADRAGLDRSPARLGHEGDDGRAVDAARQEGAERNVGDHARADGAAEMIDQLLAGGRGERFSTLLKSTSHQRTGCGAGVRAG
jgi:hypothetical protein